MQTFLSPQQKVKARLLNIAGQLKILLPEMPPMQIIFFTFNNSPWSREQSLLWKIHVRDVQFPMFALDKDRGVEGCGAEASIRSRGLKTEAGDIPGVGGGGGYPRRRAQWWERWKALRPTTTYYTDARPSRYINIGSRSSLSTLKPTPQEGREARRRSQSEKRTKSELTVET